MNDLDVHVFRFLYAALSGKIVLCVMAALTILGSGWTLLTFLPLLAFVRTRRFGATLIGSCVVTAVAVYSVKHVVQRMRPCASLADVHARIFPAPTDYSLPSGHAAGAFTCAAFFVTVLAARRPLDARRWATVAVILIVACGICVSRIALGVHFPGDVAAGALLGGITGTFGARMHLRAQP